MTLSAVQGKEKRLVMKQVYIITPLFLTKSGKDLSVGGVETYTYNLLNVINELGLAVTVYQTADKPFTVNYRNATVIGLAVEFGILATTALHAIPDKQIVVFGNEEVIFGKYNGITIGIQHGIGWDTENHRYRGSFFEWLFRKERYYYAKKRIYQAEHINQMVCVDYNYVNWYRTQVNHRKANLTVIPNFTNIPDQKPEKEKNKLNLIFARRLVKIRGTEVFTNAIIRVLDQYPDINVTIAGTGPNENCMKEALKHYSQVLFMQYSAPESLKIHRNQHIAVVPSTGSEGTSLSLLEAMASGGAVVCTDVGGMTNIVLDHYNGLIVEPQEDALTNAILSLD